MAGRSEDGSAGDADYAEARRYPTLSTLSAGLGGQCSVARVPIPLHCVDGFNEAYYGRPEMFLDPAARSACSAWSFVDDRTAETYIAHLRAELTDGTWDAHHRHLRTQPSYVGSLVLLVGRP